MRILFILVAHFISISAAQAEEIVIEKIDPSTPPSLLDVVDLTRLLLTADEQLQALNKAAREAKTNFDVAAHVKARDLVFHYTKLLELGEPVKAALAKAKAAETEHDKPRLTYEAAEKSRKKQQKIVDGLHAKLAVMQLAEANWRKQLVDTSNQLQRETLRLQQQLDAANSLLTKLCEQLQEERYHNVCEPFLTSE